MMQSDIYQSVMELSSSLEITAGSVDKLNAAIMRGADLKIETVFRHNEHVDIESCKKDTVRENSEFPATMIVDGRWMAGFMTLRQPVNVPEGFGPRASLSLFMYNQDGTQAVARPYLDCGPITGDKGQCEPYAFGSYEKMRYISCYDKGTNAPSDNFVYAFDSFRYMVRNRYTLLCSISPEGDILTGSRDTLWDAVRCGADIKVGISGLCSELPGARALEHTIYIHAGFLYHYQESGFLCVATHPFVRVATDIPLRYATDNWDYCWAVVRTDGYCELMRMDPHTLEFTKLPGAYKTSFFGAGLI